MVTGILLAVLEQQLVAWPDHERGAQLHGPGAGSVLAIAGRERSRRRHDGGASQQGRGSDLARLHGRSCVAVLVEKHRKREVLVFDECLRIVATPGADRSHRVGRELVLALADLTGPLPARESAEMAQEEQRMGGVRPQVSQAVGPSLHVGKAHVGESKHVC